MKWYHMISCVHSTHPIAQYHSLHYCPLLLGCADCSRVAVTAWMKGRVGACGNGIDLSSEVSGSV